DPLSRLRERVRVRVRPTLAGLLRVFRGRGRRGRRRGLRGLGGQLRRVGGHHALEIDRVNALFLRLDPFGGRTILLRRRLALLDLGFDLWLFFYRFLCLV